tara:strand:- start:2385 stop:4655 length:2271 start_codon:yes stop_codon:yes gene_type:complete
MADLTYKVDIETKRAQANLKALQAQTGGLTRGFKSLGVALAGFAAGAAIKGIVDITAKFEDLQTTLGSVFGSATKGAQAFSAIQAMATKTQFGIEDLSNTFIKLAGAGIQPTQKLLKTFTDTAAVTTDQIGTLQAITDLFSRTTQGGLGLEELNRLGDRGIPVFEILAQKLGITRNEVSEFGKSAEGARKITEALASGLDERFGGATAARLGNLSTLMSNFSIAIKNAAGSVGQTMGPALKNLITQITDFITKNQSLAETIGTVLGAALQGVSFLLGQLAENAKLVGSVVTGLTIAMGAKGLVGVLKMLTAGFKALTLAMIKNPFGLLAVAVASLIAYLSFENGLGRTFVQIKAALDVLGVAFGKFTAFLSDKVGKVVSWLKDRFYDFIQVLIDSYNAIATIIPGLDKISSSARELGAVVQDKVGDALEYAAGKANEMKDAIVAAIPPEVLAQYAELKKAVQDAGTAYDATIAKAKESAGAIKDASQIPGIKAGGVILPKAQTKEEIKNAKKLEDSMKSLTDRLLPLQAAKKRYAEETNLLNQALKSGKLTTDQHRLALENLNKEYQEFLKGQTGAARDWASGWKTAMDTYIDDATNAAAAANRVFTKATQGMEDAIVGFAKTGKFEFKSLLNSIVDELLRTQIKQLFANLFSAGSGSGSTGGSNILGSLGKLLGFANGGVIPTNAPVVVGERGPELLMGAKGNKVIPNEQLGGVTQVVYNINAVDSRSFREMVARDPAFLFAVSEQGRRRLPGAA